jgi:hypothetical protein
MTVPPGVAKYIENYHPNSAKCSVYRKFIITPAKAQVSQAAKYMIEWGRRGARARVAAAKS